MEQYVGGGFADDLRGAPTTRLVSGRGDAFPVTTQDEYPISGQPVASQLPDPRSVIEGTDWAALEHAYGAAQDTPLRLLQLLDEDPEVQAGALGRLDISVLHQDSLYSATAPAALFVAAALHAPSTLAPHENYTAWDDRPRPLRAALLEWLGRIADAAAYGETTNEDDGNDPDVTEAVRAVRGPIYDAVLPHLLAPDPTVREVTTCQHRSSRSRVTCASFRGSASLISGGAISGLCTGVQTRRIGAASCT
jgi:hypothetical protein